jgi:hypothetical protein
MGDGGTINGEPYIVLVHNCGLVTLPEAIKDGYILKGWLSSLAEYTGVFFYLFPGQYLFDDHYVLYPIWEKE